MGEDGGGAPRIQPIPIRLWVPSAITMTALAAGATAVRFAIGGDFARAAAAIVVAGVLDGLDGRVARLLRGTTRFGAELDSLSDVTAFGIAPALVLYLWALQHLGRLGWAVALALAVCCALRLARFNASLDEPRGPRRLGFLTGVPAPAGAGLALLPLFVSLALDDALDARPELKAALAALAALVAAGLMVSTLPTWGPAAIRLSPSARLPLLALVGLFVAFLAQAPWATLAALGFLYLASLPLAWRTYRRRVRVLGQG
ncbi:MAG: phosphatidylcholine/phosphatidylserine synthase [Sphingomonadaceae bacterium]|uniref:CDP-alcohol phosphatidyltransferase family protein n=1 Tax=Thermaurantiacus sp. TaxID=2820283 RepID=UPI00298F1B52|nr:phosphatidylcholine/phosphatidylserine synthase [Thermaurantiacus sp.]MCS6985953.1 phosphatidylcholine/phosphatidylserine synthase [Sphingomonadaceae bacterium]MDW8414831.1 phosphatidylcholine/phosphatidylserine synthase [Thermaurantiacus sp.]